MRSFLACIAGILTWIVVATLIDHALRLTINGYTAAERIEQYTLAMKWARLTMAITTSIASGFITAWIARGRQWPVMAVGAIALLIFLPIHISIWSKFPVWYHLTFLLTILPAVMLGGRLYRAPGNTAT